MGFKITKDNVHNSPEYQQWDLTNYQTPKYKGGKLKFRLCDDDNEIYFYGVSDSENFYPLDAIGSAYGCTYIEYRNEETKQYELL